MLNPRFRIISNGFGEDLIASKLIQSFRDCYDFDFDVFPLVGQGNAYKHIGMNPKLDQNVLPSGGFLLKINDIVSDLKSGLFSQFRKQRHLLKSSISDYQIVVGDVYTLFMATFGISIPTIFLPTAKSERAIPHMNIELRYIRSQTDLVFPRDIETHQRLKRAKINSYFLITRCLMICILRSYSRLNLLFVYCQVLEMRP